MSCFIFTKYKVKNRTDDQVQVTLFRYADDCTSLFIFSNKHEGEEHFDDKITQTRSQLIQRVKDYPWIKELNLHQREWDKFDSYLEDKGITE